MVAQRGECTFAQKAFNAQLAGAQMLIIVDDKYEDVSYALMVDDGFYGKFVSISLDFRVSGPDPSCSYVEGRWRKDYPVTPVRQA